MIKLNRTEKMTTLSIFTLIILISSLMILQWNSLSASTRERVEHSLTIFVSSGGTTDPTPGVYNHVEGSAVTVSAIPDEGHQFDHWELDESVNTTNPMNVLMDYNHSLNAVFKTIPPPQPGKRYLTISATKGGTSDPMLDTYEYDEGSIATITALPAIGYRFHNWELDGNVRTENPINIVMDQDYTLLAVFVVDYVPPSGSNIFGKVEDTDLKLDGEMAISNVGIFIFDPNRIATRRPDIFQPGHFSVFDVLAYLDETGEITAEYHFDEEMNTYVIDSIDGKQNWWYQVYYDGGAPESNAFRMDHYPVKDKMHIRIFQASSSEIDKIYTGFRDQIVREKQSNRMVIPEVTIKGRYETLTFKNVTVEAHNLRIDVFKPGVITAADVILSLADQGKLSYDLRWYATIGSSEIKNYYVDRINDDIAHGGCGFVYECGEKRSGWNNHIHLPSDIRVINSPEYMSWFWICLPV